MSSLLSRRDASTVAHALRPSIRPTPRFEKRKKVIDLKRGEKGRIHKNK